MNRLFCPDLPLTPPECHILPDAEVSLEPDQAHHARAVLRLRSGDSVQIFDGKGTICEGTIQFGPPANVVRIVQAQHVPSIRPVITVAAASPKGPRLRDMVNQLSQAGADHYIPLQTGRSTVHPRSGKLSSLVRIAVESAKQSHRPYLMSVNPPSPLELLVKLSYDLCLMADPTPGIESPTPDRITESIRTAQHVLICIGPEGGWTDQERQVILNAGGVAWPLGPNVMRIETAAVAAVAVVRYLATLA